MSKIIIPANYKPALNLYDTQRAIGTVKRLFADTLCATLNLYRVSAPLFLEASTGLNDDLNGVERKVTFDIIRDIHKEGMTILLVEQNAQMALSVADRAYVLETGRIVMDGTGAELLTNERVRSAYLGG